MTAPQTPGQGLITLYDIPTAKGQGTYSPYIWLVRLVLNHKGLVYRTEWIEYPDIRNVSAALGVAPTTRAPGDSGEMLWTLPMIVDPTRSTPDGKPVAVADSMSIIKYLDETYPEKRVIPEGTDSLHAIWRGFILDNVINKLVPLLIPLCPAVLTARSKEYFTRTRTAWFGPLDRMCGDEGKAWEEVKEGLNKVAEALDENGTDGERNLRVIPGQVGYGDFALVSVLLWARSVMHKEKIEELRSWNDGRWGRMLDINAGLFRVV